MRAKTIKNTVYVETNVVNMYAKFQLHPEENITETSLYKSNPRFAPSNIIKMGETWGWY